MKSKLLLISDSRELFWYCSRKLSGQCEILHSKIQDYKKVLLLAEVLSVICVILDTSSLDSSATHEIRDFVADNFDCTFFTVDSAFGPLPLEFDSGIKKLAPAESANYGRTNRSLHYMRSMKKGEKIGNGDVSVLRTEKILTPGISPEFMELITGAVLTKDVDNGAGVKLEDFIKKI